MNLEEEKRKRGRWQSFQNIRKKSLHEYDFIEFSNDEEKWMEKQGVSKQEKEKLAVEEIYQLIYELKRLFH